MSKGLITYTIKPQIPKCVDNPDTVFMCKYAKKHNCFLTVQKVEYEFKRKAERKNGRNEYGRTAELP